MRQRIERVQTGEQVLTLQEIGFAHLVGPVGGPARGLLHDHRFDPIPQSDFYRLQAFFTPIQPAHLDASFLPYERNADVQRRAEAAVAKRKEKIRQLRAKLKKKIADASGVDVGAISDEALDTAIAEKKSPITEEDASKLNALKTDKKHLRPEQRFEAKVVGIRNPNKDEKEKATFVLNIITGLPVYRPMIFLEAGSHIKLPFSYAVHCSTQNF